MEIIKTIIILIAVYYLLTKSVLLFISAWRIIKNRNVKIQYEDKLIYNLKTNQFEIKKVVSDECIETILS